MIYAFKKKRNLEQYYLKTGGNKAKNVLVKLTSLLFTCCASCPWVLSSSFSCDSLTLLCKIVIISDMGSPCSCYVQMPVNWKMFCFSMHIKYLSYMAILHDETSIRHGTIVSTREWIKRIIHFCVKSSFNEIDINIYVNCH